MELVIDVMFINYQEFLNSIDRKFKFRVLVPLDKWKKVKYYRTYKLLKVLDHILHHYDQVGIFISILHDKNEFKTMIHQGRGPVGHHTKLLCSQQTCFGSGTRKQDPARSIQSWVIPFVVSTDTKSHDTTSGYALYKIYFPKKAAILR